VEELRRRAEEHCGKGVLEEACLLELGWCTEEVIVLYLTCERCRKQGCHVEDNRGQGVISREKLEEMKWCGYIGKATQPREAVINFIRPYLHQLSIDSHSLNGYGKPLKRPFDRYQSCLEAINNGRDIRQINW